MITYQNFALQPANQPTYTLPYGLWDGLDKHSLIGPMSLYSLAPWVFIGIVVAVMHNNGDEMAVLYTGIS